jgi:hypothetical protein
MIDVHEIWVIAAVLSMVALATMGLAGITTGWVPRWGRNRVLRPKLWGYGAVVSAVGMTAFMLLGPLGAAPPAHTYVPPAGIAVYLVGLGLQMLAQRPGRALQGPL